MTDSTYTHLAFVVDRSGSMYSIQEDMEGAIRSLLSSQDALGDDLKLKVDITTFDTVVEFPYKDVTVSEVSDEPIIVPRGGTALLDAVGQTIVSLGERLSALPEEERPGTVIVAIVTDGQENSSREYTNERIKELLTDQQDTYSWSFLFLGANIDSFSVAGNWGIARGSTLQYTASSEGVFNLNNAANNYFTNTRLAGSYVFTDEDRDESKAESTN